MMKKILAILVIFLFLEQAEALDIESRLTEARQQIVELENKVTTNENTRLDKIYPVGTIFKTTTYSTVSQVETALGGKWESYGNGKTLVGVNTSDSTFNAVGKTGGSAITTLVSSNIPAHNHTIPALSGTTNSAGTHTHHVYVYYGQSGYSATIPPSTHYVVNAQLRWTTSTLSNKNHMNGISATSAGAHTHAVTTTANTSGSAGSGTAFTNLQPYITVYMYKRVG